jgi:hypothetical protein
MRTAVPAIALGLVVAVMPTFEGAASEPVPEYIPSFNESPGCDDLDGFRGPLATAPGQLPLSERIYGPWGDFYGRTVGLAWNQRVEVTLPNMTDPVKTLYIHERVLPSFQLVLDNLAAAEAGGNTYTIRSPHTFSWAMYTVPPRRHLSFHAVGASIDVNSTTNPYRADNVLITDMPQWFVDAWRDAGWCWGGDWQSIKDPMHYSWKGPLHTPGYTMPPPQPPLVSAAAFGAQFDLRVGLMTPAPAGATHHVVDIDRDGAVDVVRVQPWGATNRIALVAALARNAHNVANVRAITATAPVDPAAPVTLADVTRDGRPDLVYLLPGGGDTLSLEVFALTQWGELTSEMRSTPIPYGGDEVVLFDDLDRDGDTDLFVITPGSPASLTVWLGPDFVATAGPFTLAVPSAGHRFAVGDRTVNGQRDLFALGPDGKVTVHLGSFYGNSQVVATDFVPAADDRFFVADLDGDGHSDLFLASPSGSTRMRRGGASTHHPGVWYEMTAVDTADFACPTSFIGAPYASNEQVGLVDPATGIWCLRGSLGQVRSFYYGNPGDRPMMGDWNCNGVDTPGLYRQSDGFVYLRNSNTQGVANIRFFFGNPNDIPLAGDFNGNGCDTVSIYRPSTGQVFIINSLGANDGGLGAADFSYYFGNPGDIPFVGDFDNSGVDTVGLYRPTTGLVYYRNDHLQGNATHQFFFGNPGDRFVAGDWNDNGIDTPGVYRPSQRTIYLRFTNTQGVADGEIRFGDTHWLPVSGRFGS